MLIIKSAVIFIFLLISILHLYWASGGEWGIHSSIPTINGDRVFTPSSIGTYVIAVAVAGFALLYGILAFGHNLNFSMKNYLSWIGWLVALIFIARAIGDFHLVGFFKTINGTTFSVMDTRYYSPLCLFLGVNFAYVSYNWK